MSAPRFARELEQTWCHLPVSCWSILGFRFLDRMLRKNLARCFDRAGHLSVAQRLTALPPVDDADSWRRSLALLRDLPEVADSSDTELLAAFCCVTGNLPPAILDQPSDRFLRQASAIALILENFAAGSFDAEVAAQRVDISALQPE